VRLLELDARPVGITAATVTRIAALTAANVATAVWVVRYGLDFNTVLAAGLVATLAAVSVVDLEERRIPNRLTLPATAAALAAVALLHPDRLSESALSAAGSFLFFFVPALLVPRAVGMGDAKLALLLGGALGADVLLALFAASLGAGVAATILLVREGVAARHRAIPFGPFLTAGGTLALVVGGGCIYP
jgi:leader peptidase (prepilin peptidase)/N-methyltransferase